MTDLNAMMDFDHVVRVDSEGNVTDAEPDVYAPDVNEDTDGTHVDPDSWSLMTGYSGQYMYGGPVMHASEYVGGGMARDILATPGLYVCVVVYDMRASDDDDDNIAGWAVAYIHDEDED